MVGFLGIRSAYNANPASREKSAIDTVSKQHVSYLSNCGITICLPIFFIFYLIHSISYPLSNLLKYLYFIIFFLGYTV